jgi:hypothetical protein
VALLARAPKRNRCRLSLGRRTGGPGAGWLLALNHFPASDHTAIYIAIYLTGLATILLLAIPFIPGLRDIPRWIPVHRLIWRNWEPAHADTGSRSTPAVVTPAAPPPVAEPPNPT